MGCLTTSTSEEAQKQIGVVQFYGILGEYALQCAPCVERAALGCKRQKSPLKYLLLLLFLPGGEGEKNPAVHRDCTLFG